MGVMLLAGGPTDQAHLGRVRLVRSDPVKGTTSQEYDVENYLKTGDTSQNPTCQPGDTIWVPRRRGALVRSLRIVPLILGSIASGVGLYYTLNRCAPR
jgi:protein involved in polysaccharide export with SLBB domain